MAKTLNLEECAAFLKVHPNTVSDLAVTGELPGAKIGRAWVFVEDDVLDYLREQVRIQVERRKSAQGTKVIAYYIAPEDRRRGRRRPLPRLPELPIALDEDNSK